MTGTGLHGQTALVGSYGEPAGHVIRRGHSLDLPARTTTTFKAALPTIPQGPKPETASIRSFRSFRSFRSIVSSKRSFEGPTRPSHSTHALPGEVLDTSVEDAENEKDQAALSVDLTGSSFTSGADTPLEILPPLPHIPLRKKSSQTLRLRTVPAACSPLNEDGQPRAAQVSPTSPVANGLRRIFSAPRLRGDAQHKSTRQYSNPSAAREAVRGDVPSQEASSLGPRVRGMTTSQLPATPRTPDWPLQSPRSNISLTSSAHQIENDVNPARDSSETTMPSEVHSKLQEYHNALRESYRSYLTNASSSYIDASGTERSSVVTKSTSYSDLTGGHHSQRQTEDQSMSVEDAIEMYADGFADTPLTESVKDMPSETDFPQPARSGNAITADVQADGHANSPAAVEEVSGMIIQEDQPKPTFLPSATRHVRSSTQIFSRDAPPPAAEPTLPKTVPRDCYGFKKSSQYFTPEQYDAWNGPYVQYLERRRKKWHHLMKQYGLSTGDPIRFPPKTDKVKRYVRKGIPPEWRGAAWFWYAGGPGRLAENPGLYWDLVEQVDSDKLSDADREHIERDLNRTFPDNIRFKPDATCDLEAAEAAGGPSHPSCTYGEPETPIVRALRRVLQAFAIHNPSIGYCQSLNFLAGLLLLFLDEDEEKAFVMLNIITNEHLPGTHGRVLEANVDIVCTTWKISMWSLTARMSGSPTLKMASAMRNSVLDPS